MSESDLPRIAVLTCGGTISSSSVGGVAMPRMGAEALVQQVPQLAECAIIQARTVMTKPSPDVTLADVMQLFDALVEEAATCDGLVVTHGTDTLEEVVFALDLMWKSEVPVVVTGAMRVSDAVGADGGANLLAAVRAAAAATARGAGVVVVFNDQIHSARHVRKSHTSSVATFVSPTLGPIGYFAEGEPRLPFRPERGVGLDRPTFREAPRVPLLTMTIGDDETALDALAAADLDGLVLAGFGGGHLPERVARSRGLEQLLERIPVVLTSRAGAGEPLTRTYGGFDGSETTLLGRGLVTSGRLDGPKSKVLLSLLLASGCGRDAIRAEFADLGK